MATVEWQHRSSPHVHGLALLTNAPDVNLLHGDSTDGNEICDYIDSIFCTLNPAISSDGSDALSAPQPLTNPHIYEKPFVTRFGKTLRIRAMRIFIS